MSGACALTESADDAIRGVLRAHWAGEPAVVVDAPPGAGKTWLVLAAAAQAAAKLEERCIVVTQTNQQSFDLVERFAGMFGSLGVTLLCREGLVLPDRPAFRRGGPIVVADSPGQLHPGPGVIVANASKLLQSRLGRSEFGTMIVDEAYQLPNHQFLGLSPMAESLVLVGDPGQIDPVVQSDTTRWAEDPTGPHVSAPAALLAGHPEVHRIQLPVSRRLLQDSVDLIAPAFYPDLRFSALARHPERRLVPGSVAPPLGPADAAMDEALRRAATGTSLIGVVLPEASPLADDPEIARWIVAGVMRACRSGLHLEEAGVAAPVSPERIGVVCASRNQVRAVKQLLPRTLSEDVLVETANRYQGLERDLVLVWHPLTGRARTGGFHFDAGRLCVMLSRHRGACVVYSRPDVPSLIEGMTMSMAVPLGAAGDPESEGRAAHRRVWLDVSDPRRMIHPRPVRV